jgi:hypothetical protein
MKEYFMKNDLILKCSLILNVVLLLIIFLILFSGVGTPNNKESIKDNPTTTEKMIESETIKSELNQYCKARKGIFLYKSFNTANHTAEGTKYSLILRDDYARLEVAKPGGLGATCDFSVEKFYELQDILCSTNLEEYTPDVDSDGKIIYETLEYAVFVSDKNNDWYNHDSSTVYFKSPTNLDEIITYFENLYAVAKK